MHNTSFDYLDNLNVAINNEYESKEIVVNGLEGFNQTLDINPDSARFNLFNSNEDSNFSVLYSQYLSCRNMDQDPDAVKLFVRTMDNKSFRLYLSHKNYLDSNGYQNAFCLLLSSLKEGQSVRIILGNSLDSWWEVLSLGPMLHAMQNCKAEVITSVVGRCGSVESFIWLFGKHRTFNQYGEISFRGIRSVLASYPVYKDYFLYLFEKVMMYNIITEEQKEMLLTTDNTVHLNYYELNDTQESA